MLWQNLHVSSPPQDDAVVDRETDCMHRHRNKLWGLLLLGMACIQVACREHTATTGGSSDSSATRITAAQLQAAIDRSAHYLAGLCDDRGQFTYRTHLDPQVEQRPAYNVLRHAGAVVALAQYCQRSHDAAACAAMRRAAEFLRRDCLGPVAGNANLLAAWSDPVREGNQEPRQAKLGGAGLALVALLSVERMEPGSIPLPELQALGTVLDLHAEKRRQFLLQVLPRHRTQRCLAIGLLSR